MRMVLPLCAAMLVCALAKADQNPLWDVAAQNKPQVEAQPRGEARRGRRSQGPLDLTAMTSHPLLRVAARDIGKGNIAHTGRAWCADALGLWLRRAGYRSLPTGLAVAYMRYPGPRLPGPVVGAIAASRGHVTIVAKVLSNGRFIGLGGNQSHRVKPSVFASSRFTFHAPVREN